MIFFEFSNIFSEITLFTSNITINPNFLYLNFSELLVNKDIYGSHLFTLKSAYLSSSVIFIFLYFFSFFNIWMSFALLIFILQLLPNFYFNSSMKNRLNSYWFLISTSSIYRLVLVTLLLLTLLIFSFSSTELTFIYSAFVYTDFQFKYLIFNSFFFLLIFTSLLSSSFLSGQNVFEFFFFVINLNIWLISLVFANNLLIFIFSVEILSTINFVLFVLSIFNQTTFYNLNDMDDFKYFNNTNPSLYLQTLIYMYWVGLIGSLLLFIFLVFFYKLTLTLDFYLLIYLYEWYFFNLDFSTFWFINSSITWIIFLVIIFLKCAIFPFFFWKPSLFKGIPLHVIQVYITLYFFSLFLYLNYFLFIYLPSIFYFFIFELYLILFIGLIFLTLSILDSYFFKTFFALSSSINTLFIFMLTVSWTSESYLLFI